ncbi:GNAT family N-acetyltransferase [Angustibacter luteus]|uniref:GNAT family N-acetyltransferase n=1 Tax=Angustibacter luteus TaxID=658456 RepID=A0ABW1JBE1_9ACTN
MKRLSNVTAGATATRLPSLTATVRLGTELLDAAGPELDALADACGAPSMARAGWLHATVGPVPTRAWSVEVRDDRGALRAAAVLVDEQQADRDVVRLAGSSTGHTSALLADDAAAASLLGHAFWDALRERGRPTWAILGPVRVADPVLAAFTAAVPGADLVSASPVPVVRRGAAASAAEYLTPSMQRTLRKAANRARTDGCAVDIRFTRDPHEIAALLPDLERLHRERDHEHGRRSELDDDVDLRVWRARLTALAAQGRLEVATSHIDSVLAAQVVGLVDSATYRVLEGVLATKLSRYSPGRVLETAVLQRVLDDPTLDTLDWVTSVASEALLTYNDATPVCLCVVSVGAS